MSKKTTRCKAKTYKDCFECPWPDCIRNQHAPQLKGESIGLELCNPPKVRLITDDYTEDSEQVRETKQNEG